MKATIVTILSGIGILFAPMVVRQETGATKSVPSVQQVQDLPPVHPSGVLLPGEAVTVTPTKKASPATTKKVLKAKVWTCGQEQESAVGGTYRACEWK